MSYDSLLIHSVYLNSEASSQNDLGEWTVTYTQGTTAYDCRYSPIKAEEVTQLPGDYNDVRYKCFCKSSNTITRGMKVSDGNHDYRVKEVIIDSSGHHKTAYLVML